MVQPINKIHEIHDFEVYPRIRTTMWMAVEFNNLNKNYENRIIRQHISPYTRKLTPVYGVTPYKSNTLFYVVCENGIYTHKKICFKPIDNMQVLITFLKENEEALDMNKHQFKMLCKAIYERAVNHIVNKKMPKYGYMGIQWERLAKYSKALYETKNLNSGFKLLPDLDY